MLKKFCFISIQFFVQLIKKIKLDIYAFDKIMLCVGEVQISQNKNRYEEITDLTETEVKIFSQNGEDGIINYLVNKLKLNASIIILFNHDSKFRNPRFLFPRLINAIKKRNYSFVKKIYLSNISGDFLHASDNM